MTTANQTMLNAALEWVKSGWKVFPVGIDKKPLTTHGFKDATETILGVREYWKRWPDADIASPTKGLIVIDFDSRHGGLDSLKQITAKYGLPVTRVHKTGGGGYHYIYRNTTGRRIGNTTGLGGYSGVDLRADDGYIVLPPSKHESGNHYKVLHDSDITDCPQWVIDLLDNKAGSILNIGQDGEPIPPGSQDDWLYRRACSYRAQGDSYETILEKVKLDISRCPQEPGREPYTDKDAERIAKSASRHTPNTTTKKPKPEIALTWANSALTHDALMRMEFQPTKWIVDNMIPAASLTILGGKKKLGKSWLALQIGQCVAADKPVLDKSVTQGKVVIMALEDGIKRLRSRLEAQHSPGDLPITYITKFEPLNTDAGKANFEDMLTNQTPILCVIDTLAAAKTGKTEENEAGGMADLMNYIRGQSQAHDCAILVVAHHGKATHGNVGDDIRGSSAIAGAADLNMGLYKVESGFELQGEGRDIEEFNLKIEFDVTDAWQWQLVGDARQIARDQAENEVLDALQTLIEADASAIGQEVGKSRQAINTTLKRLRKDNRVEYRTLKVSGGTKLLYRLPGEIINE